MPTRSSRPSQRKPRKSVRAGAAAHVTITITTCKRLDLFLKAMESFLILLFEKGRFGFLGHINDFYQKLADELKGVARATVTSATALSADAVERIRAALSKRTGKDIILDVKQDPRLIGGVITQIGDLVLDGSIGTQLRNMRESLKRGEGV